MPKTRPPHAQQLQARLIELARARHRYCGRILGSFGRISPLSLVQQPILPGGVHSQPHCSTRRGPGPREPAPRGGPRRSLNTRRQPVTDLHEHSTNQVSPTLATQYAPDMQPTRILRREFLVTASRAALFTSLAPAVVGAAASEPTAARLPRWRGFNLIEKFTADRRVPFRESDFEWLAEWGFDFVRLPLSYHTWAKPDDWLKLDEAVLKEIDDAVDLGRRHNVHVNINLHRAPGYCVNPPKEPLSLWEHDEALEACAFHWAHFAKRYRGIPSSRVSFNLLNEPPDIPVTTYARVVRRLVEAIRAEDPDRLIVADGLRWGRDPVPGLVDLHIAQSTRGYDPMGISHYRASWIGGADQWPEPTWPLTEGDRGVLDKERLRRERIQPWQAIEGRGVGVHVGEWGAFRHTPHRVVLAWMKDCLELWRQAGWGWALWNFRGSFGILDSGRKDVAYEEFRGHQLDRQMLDLLRET